jgi:hypothetical protein
MPLNKENTKSILLSKTFWMQVLAIVALLIPASAAFIKEYFAEMGMGWALVNVILRLVTKDKVEISLLGK